jgi:hypothetical protein
VLKRSVLYLLLPLSCIAASEVPQAAANPTPAPTAIVRRGPVISSVTPSTGEHGTEVTITGSGFGDEQGASEVWLGATKAVVQSWSDTRIVAVPAAGSLSGSVRVLRNGALSNPVSLPGAPPAPWQDFQSRAPGSNMIRLRGGAGRPGSRLGSGPLSWFGSKTGPVESIRKTANRTAGEVTLTPGTMNLLMGETHTIRAVDSSGRPVAGLTWASSDPSVVRLSAGDPPVVTALAPGKVTITAGTAMSIISTEGNIEDLGTVIWTNPGNGSGVYTIVPAVPGPDAVADVFAFRYDGTVQAITSEGDTAWTADVSLAWGGVADFRGGLLTAEYDGDTSSLVRINGATGQRTVLYSVVNSENEPWHVCAAGVHPDGTVFMIRCSGDWHQPARVIGIDPDTGAQKFSVPAGEAITGDEPYVVRADGIGMVGSAVIVAGDGYAYVPYAYQVSPGAVGQPCQNHLKLLRIDSSGASSDMAIHDWPDACQEGFAVQAFSITNADQGILLSWTTPLDNGGYDHGMVTAGGTGVTPLGAPGVPNQIAFAPDVRTQDGWLVGTAVDASENVYLAAIDAGGGVHWTAPGLYWPKVATADGGVIAAVEDGSAVVFDRTGGTIAVYAQLPIQAWTGNAYIVDSSAVKSVSVPTLATAMSPYWSFAGGNPSGNGTSPLCHDERDPLIAEYASIAITDSSYYKHDWEPDQWPRFTPNCRMLTHSAHSSSFTFEQIKQRGTLGWALIQRPLVVPASSGYGLDKWLQEYQQSRTITSGYRSPSRNQAAGGAPNSRHILGDAIDFRNVSRTEDELIDMNEAAIGAKANFIEEPGQAYCGTTLKCAHADWRFYDRNKYASPGR